MYTPPIHRQDDPEATFAFMREFPFGTLVTCGEDGMTATHIPLTVERAGDSYRISGHIAKANAQAAHLEAGAETMAIFAGPHSYVSPSNYEPGLAVPTWNYVAVHAYGAPSILASRDAKLAALAATIAAHDPAYQGTLDSYPGDWIDAKLKGIVAFEISVRRVDARWKLSQDRQPVERERISLGMRLSGDPSAERLAGYMDEHAEAATR